MIRQSITGRDMRRATIRQYFELRSLGLKPADAWRAAMDWAYLVERFEIKE